VSRRDLHYYTIGLVVGISMSITVELITKEFTLPQTCIIVDPSTFTNTDDEPAWGILDA